MRPRIPHSLFALLFVAGAEAAPVSRQDADVRRGDWYLRESLSAIRDWEAILERFFKETPEDRRVPTLPVPADGQTVEWPNPIPLALAASQDAHRHICVRMADKNAEVRWLRSESVEQCKTLPSGSTILGYKHLGGGGKDHWYHGYNRHFDTLTHFRPMPAPFAVRIGSCPDLKRGANTIRLSLRNASDRPLELTLRLTLWSPRSNHPCGEQKITLEPRAQASPEFRVLLDSPGGRLLVASVQCAGTEYWLPILTHVEDVPAVLRSIDQVLSDRPNAAASQRLDALRRQVTVAERNSERAPGAAWRDLFEQASALRDDLLIERIPHEAILFLKRKPFDSEQPFMDAHHLRNRPGGGIYRLSPVRPDGKVTPVIDSLGEGVYRDLCLHWSGKRFLFAFGNGSDQWDGKQSYDIYEANVDGSGLRRLTSGPHNDCEPFYLPSGQIGFTSDRSEHFVMCGGNRHAPTLFVMEADGADVRQLSFNVFNDFNPTVLPNGQILYSRWEYNERSVTSLHNPFTINPDGTMMAPYYGNATISPNVVQFPRPVPDSLKVMALFTAHHGQTHGPIGLIDVGRGVDGNEPLTLLTPHIPVTSEKALDSKYGWFSDPTPLSETTYLCSFTPTVLPWLERSWALYVGDQHGNIGLVYRDPEISCAEPVPLVTRPRPHVRPPASTDAAETGAEARLLLLDTYVGLPGVPRDTARYVRIIEDVPRKGVRQGGVITTAGTLIFTIKRVLGTVPIESDGSAHFVVPANRNVYFEVLDKDYLEIQRMRSVVCLKPGEIRTCVGCHERRTTSPPNRPSIASARRPSHPAAPPWGTQTVSFLRDVQPILNEHCVRCHTHDRQTHGAILTDDLTDRFTVGYEELLAHIKAAISNRWDHPDDVYVRPPYTYGSKVSPLTKLLDGGHHGVQLDGDERLRLVTWIDTNGVYYDTYQTYHWPNRSIFKGAEGKAMQAVYGRRCASCHGKGDGQKGTWWLSLDRRDPKRSRALMAPLAPSAGGWGRCDGGIFADTQDSDYQTMLTALAKLHQQLQQHPRADLRSVRGTLAEAQTVELPPPPPPRPKRDDPLPGEEWVWLSDLAWTSAKSGWTPNKDGLPRRDRDITDAALRLVSERYGKGIGTHAPSEIIYRLDGKYEQFFARIGAAESGGTVVFQVYADDKRLFDSGVMHGLDDAKQVDVSVKGTRTLRLVVTDAGDGYNADMANWAGARLRRWTSVGAAQ
ncbi:MAG: NPCBM/NEW2 domain-containing protein [Phycisphaerae bacterium]|nr:NPCBM/NEW2 domain-containing protein [Phycisphaerae bacterium]